jgi:hypothetical protein
MASGEFSGPWENFTWGAQITHRGRPELVILSIDAYALLRRGRKLALTRDDMASAARIAANRMDPEYAALDALMDD